MFSSTSYLLLAMVGCACAYNAGAYNGGYNTYEQQQGHQAAYSGSATAYKPKVAIINHKQAAGSDGSFNYAFNAENGIQQGESIGPDGSRHGSYSYVDPNGKTVQLKYVAGKDGFRVVEGDHIPRQVPLPAHHVAAYQAAAAAQVEASHSAGGNYHAAAEQPANYQAYHSQGDDGSYKPTGDDGQYRSNAYTNAAEESYSGPHNYGSGFAFEFGGHKY